MRVLLLCAALLTLTPACKKTDCTYNGHTLHRGPQGGCYYINSSGDKEYVDRANCNCS